MGNKEKRVLKFSGLAGFLLLACAFFPRPAEANIVSGVTKMVVGIFSIPLTTLAGTFSGPPIFGTLMGAVNGTIRGVGLVTSGALELALDGAGLAKAAAPYVLPFLF